ncbi:enoyl-ACP reductase [Acetobacter estunensis NRIC 0472]|uniref:Nitronate monooxygenase n=1 Tax=Acetobacter estunensis TaxID=104097 RepID=A0A967EE84_9PROT|nr:nitronate monooxygenase [Acetobacter estunensis]NHO54790.1 nitronate monooxygenase [Acetobacter estunensis]GBQ23853.1 enoyl-ACP reductase [Acetobacter estunensis NRIC 0472]
MTLYRRLGIEVPIIQAPMAGVATPALAAAVSNVGGLGSLGLGASSVSAAVKMIHEVRQVTDRPFGVNLFVHETPMRDVVRERAWLDVLAPFFAENGMAAPQELGVPYTSFRDDPDMLAMLLELRPPVVSFHFGLPSADIVSALKGAGIVLLATATNPVEAQAIAEAGMDMVIAQGIEAGGHRGMFDPDAPDDEVTTAVLTRRLGREAKMPVIAAGGLMDGAGVVSVLKLGAVAAQLGTAFIGCVESAADEGYRTALAGPGAEHTRMTRLISGRPARALANRFTQMDTNGVSPPVYPVAYDAGKALHAAARKHGEQGFGAHWAGQGAPLCRFQPAAHLMKTLIEEMRAAGWKDAVVS